jgi:polysaccharide biosynthesis/export protein
LKQSKINMTHVLTRATGAVAIASLLSVTGCETNSFLNPGELPVGVEKTPRVVPILENLTAGLDESNAGFEGARDVKAEDTEIVAEDYRVGPGDLIQIVIPDLVAPTLVSTDTKRIAEKGWVSIQSVGQIDVAGLTELEIQEKINQALKDKGIIQVPQTQVSVLEAQNKLFTVMGNVQTPGPKALPKADFRLLDALSYAGGVPSDAQIDYIYIIRKLPQKTGEAPGATPVIPGAPGADPLQPRSQIDTSTPSLTLLTLEPDAEAAKKAAEDALNRSADALKQAEAEAAAKAEEEAKKAAEAAAAQAAQPAQPAAPVEQPAGPAMQVEGAPAGVDPLAPAAPMETPSAPPVESVPQSTDAAPFGGPGESAFEFSAPKEPTDREIIRVPYDELKRGSLRFNIAIKPNDYIHVPSPISGEYYMAGNVQRVGVYSLANRRITLKQAIISAGMMNDIAIPQRSRLVRRIGRNQEMIVRIDLERIYAGLEPDIVLKPDDQVHVGTNFGAPFLAAIRNGFRVTYGFGFLYDRNYGDQDNR